MMTSTLSVATVSIAAILSTVAAAEEPRQFAIQNDKVGVALDESARLVQLTNLRSKWNYAGKQRLWRLFYTERDVRDIEATAAGTPQISADGSSITVRHNGLESPQKKRLNIVVEFCARLEPKSDDVRWTNAVENHEPGIVITEVQFPLVGNCQLPSEHALIWSRLGGQRFSKPKLVVRQFHTQYMGSDQNGIKMGDQYPGHLATNCFVFAGAEQGLYFGSHDPSLQTTLHLFRLLDDQLQAGFAKYPFLKTGGKFASADFILSPYSGTWHVAAKKYRNWSNCWFSVPADRPEWVRRMTGWQRVILRHQYGETFHPYNSIVQMARDGLSCGIDSLLLFAWWQAGMDANYPAYAFDEAQGGGEALAKQIRTAHDLGCRVQIYFNGRLIDKESEFYRSGEASRITLKDLRGNEWNESYHFRGDGTTTWQFGRKTFVVACPASQAWQARRLEWVDRALALGVDAVFFDQLGKEEQPCTDASHGHPVPLTSCAKIQAARMREIRQHIRAKNSDAAFGSEFLNDVVGSQADYLHSLSGFFGATSFIEWFRYTCPEVICSDREIYEDRDIERRVNLTVLRGLRSDVCVWRCRGTIVDTPHYREYLGKANALRKKYAEFLLEGLYRDTEPLRGETSVVYARAFEAGDRMLVALTQSLLPEAKTLLQVPGYRPLSTDGLGEYQSRQQGDGLEMSLKRNALVVAIFKKE